MALGYAILERHARNPIQSLALLLFVGAQAAQAPAVR